MRKEPPSPSALQALARTMSPALLAEVADEARRRAKEELVTRLTDALVSEVLATGQCGPQRDSAAVSAKLAPAVRSRTGCYLYAIADAPQQLDLSGLDSVDRRSPVRLLRVEGLGAVVSDVDVDEFLAGQESADLSEDGWLVSAV